MTDDDVEYCAKCGYAKFNEDGTESHADEEEYDHDFEPEEDDSLTLQDIDKGLDVLDKGIDVWNKLTRPSKIDPSELTSDRFKVPPPIAKVRDLELGEHPDVKAEKRHKEIMKWTKIGFIVATALTIAAIIFN